MTQNLAGLRAELGAALPGADPRADGVVEHPHATPEAADEEPLVGAGAAIVLAAVFGGLFWVAIYTLVF